MEVDSNEPFIVKEISIETDLVTRTETRIELTLSLELKLKPILSLKLVPESTTLPKPDSNEPFIVKEISIETDLVTRTETRIELTLSLELELKPILSLELVPESTTLPKPKLKKLFPLQTQHLKVTLWQKILFPQLLNKS